eukprot:8619102-Lingulodinium_polyedra.AAC.1
MSAVMNLREVPSLLSSGGPHLLPTLASRELGESFAMPRVLEAQQQPCPNGQSRLAPCRLTRTSDHAACAAKNC